jgi:DNA-binding HxlR family transcriptional regulator
VLLDGAAKALRVALMKPAMARPIPFSAPPSAAFIRALDIIGSKWAILALVCLADGPKRFNEVGRALTGISRRMLSITLRSLEQYGVVTRTVHATRPLKVVYALTVLGETAVPAACALTDWLEAHMSELEEAVERLG